jgi:hypothetical protein
VKGFDDHSYSYGLKDLIQAICDLFGKTFLYLQATAERID